MDHLSSFVVVFMSPPASREWTPWTAWTECSANCGFANRLKTRNCVFVGGLKGKKDCGFTSYLPCQGHDQISRVCYGVPKCTEFSCKSFDTVYSDIFHFLQHCHNHKITTIVNSSYSLSHFH